MLTTTEWLLIVGLVGTVFLAISGSRWGCATVPVLLSGIVYTNIACWGFFGLLLHRLFVDAPIWLQ